MCYYTNRQKDTNYSICMRKALVRLHQGFSIPFCQGVNRILIYKILLKYTCNIMFSYAIILPGKRTKYSLCTRKALVLLHQGFSIPFCQGGLNPRLTTALCLRSAICKYSRLLYLPQRKQ